MSDTPITLYHNPNCSTSRWVLAALREAGRATTVVDYLKVGWTAGQLSALGAAAGGGVSGLLRRKEPLARELGLTEPGATDDQLVAAMIAHPVLVERPIIATASRTVVCRPKEAVLPLLAEG